MSVNVTKVFDSVTPQLIAIQRAFNQQGRRKLLLSAGQEFLRQIRSNLSTNTKYKEKQWPPLSPKYAKRVGRSQATLKQSGALYRSIQMNSPRKNWVEIYTKSPYAATHFMGDKRRNIPQRNFFPMQLYSPTYSRLLFQAEKDLIFEIGKQLTIQSSGVLPRLSTSIVRSPPQYGNPFSAPMSSE